MAFLFLAMGLLGHGGGMRAILTRAGRLTEARSAPATGLADLGAMQRFASGPGPFAFNRLF